MFPVVVLSVAPEDFVGIYSTEIAEPSLKLSTL